MSTDLTGWTEIFQAGTRRGEPYTVRDLDDIVANYQRFKGEVDPPCCIGHEEPGASAWHEDTGLPAAGWVADLKRDGTTLYARFADVPPIVRRLIDRKAYRKCSAEIYRESPEGIDADGMMLRRVAFLGGELPHVKSLSDIDALWHAKPKRFAEPAASVVGRSLTFTSERHLPNGTYVAFFEVTKMADETATESSSANPVEQIAMDAIKAAFPSMPDEFLSSLSPDQMGMLAPAITPATAEETAEPPPAAMAEWPEGMTRDDVVAALVTMGEDPSSLEGMSDDDLLALYNEKNAATAMSEKKAVPFAELRRQVRQIVAAEVAKATTSLRKETADRMRNHIRTFCEDMIRTGKLSPSQGAFDVKTGQPVGAVAKRLSRANAVRKFAGGKTELDMQMDEIRAAPARSYSEKIREEADAKKKAGTAMSADRRQELLSKTVLGRSILKQDNHRN